MENYYIIDCILNVNEYLRHGKLVVPSHLDLKLQMMVAQELGLTDLARLINEKDEKEQMDMRIAHMTANIGPSQRNRRQDDRRYGGDDRRRSTKGPGPGQSGASDDGWQAPTRPARVTTEKFDTNRIKNMGASKVDADQMSFGPPKGGGGSFGAWGRGNQSGKNSRQEQVRSPGKCLVI